MRKLDGHWVKFGFVILLLAALAFLVYQQSQSTMNSFKAETQPLPPHQTHSESDPVIVAAGDIACEPGGKASSVGCQQMATAQLVQEINPKAVLTLGDNQYPDGRLDYYASAGGFEGSWGKFKSIIHPVPGNHEYMTQNAKGYYDYFGPQAGDPSKGYYSFDLGTWHLIALNSEIDVSDNSPQRQWLKEDLKQHSAYCTLAYWHKPRFSSGFHADDKTFDGLWRDLYTAGADVVLNGHSHNYERFEAQDPDGKLDGLHGITEFTSGVGGRDFEPLTGRKAHSVVLQNTNFGVLKVTLHPKSYSFSFVSIHSGQQLSDGGELPCH